jgi:hypothetical protein
MLIRYVAGSIVTADELWQIFEAAVQERLADPSLTTEGREAIVRFVEAVRQQARQQRKAALQAKIEELHERLSRVPTRDPSGPPATYPPTMNPRSRQA